MKKLLAIMVLGLLLNFLLPINSAYAIRTTIERYFCQIFETEKCIEKKHWKEARKYCSKIYPLTREDYETLSKQYDNNSKCRCEYMKQKGHKKACRTFNEILKDVTNEK